MGNDENMRVMMINKLACRRCSMAFFCPLVVCLCWGGEGMYIFLVFFRSCFFSDGGEEVPAVPGTKFSTKGPSTGTRTCTGSSYDTSLGDHMQVLYL